MKSALYLNEVTPNRSRRFGSATVYYPAKIIRGDGSEVMALFTDAELTESIRRAAKNPEDTEEARRMHASELTRKAKTMAILGLVTAFASTLLVALWWTL